MLLDPETWRQAPYQNANGAYGAKGGLLDSFLPKFTPPAPRPPAMPRVATPSVAPMQPQPFIGDYWGGESGGGGVPSAYPETNGGELFDLIKNISKYTPGGMAIRGIGSLYDALRPAPSPSIGTGVINSGYSTSVPSPMPKANGLVEVLSRSPYASESSDEGGLIPYGLESGQDAFGGQTAPNGVQYENAFIGRQELPDQGTQQYLDDGWYLDDSGTWYRD